MNLKSESLRFKISIYFTIVSMILLLCIGLLFFESNKTAIADSKNKEFGTLAEETENKVERFLFERYGDLQVMSNSPVLTRDDVDKTIKYEYIKSVRNAYRAYDYIITTDVKGNIELISGNLNNDVSYTKWLNYVLNGRTYVSDFIYLPSQKTYVIYFLAPLRDNSGKIKGSVVERVNFKSINDIVTSVKLGETGRAYIVSQTGANKTFSDYKVYNNVNSIRNSKSIYYAKCNNIKYIYFSYPIRKYATQKDNWYIILQQPEKEAFNVSYNLKNYTIIIIITSMFIIFILSLITSRKITKPINIMNFNLKSMEQKVIKISGQLEKSVARAKNLETLAAMSAGMAHEIRNPLTSIKGYAQYIKLELSDNDEVREDIDIIIDEVDRLNKIINQFLNFARPKDLNLKDEDVNDIIREVIKLVDSDLQKNNIQLSLRLNRVCLIKADRDQILGVMINMIKNSVQAMDNGGRLKITTGVIKTLHMVYIQIRDNGSGIDPESYDKIFEPFFTTKDKGIGLGLPICLRIIQNHKGFIEVKSNKNVGTMFIIKFPAL